jgi:poly(A) polymerase
MFNKLFSAYETAGFSLFFVGGAVRDFVLNKISPFEFIKKKEQDVDFATSATPQQTIKILSENNYKVIPIGIDFGTIQTVIEGVKVEITTYRSESYTKGSRKPSVVFGAELAEDLSRRDFSINALAMTKDFHIIDLYKGMEDLKNKILSTPSYPDISFVDDPLRMLRACRFVARFGFAISEKTKLAMIFHADKIHNISAERVFEEMSKLLMTKDPTDGLELMVSTGLMRELFPEIQAMVDFRQDQGRWHSKLVWPHVLGVVRQSPQKLSVRWAALFHDIAKPQTYTCTDNGVVHFYTHEQKGALMWEAVARRLKVSKDFEKYVSLLVYEHLSPSLLVASGVPLSKRALRRLIHRVGPALGDLFELSLADVTSHNVELTAYKRKQCCSIWEQCKEILNESDIVQLKLPTGLGLLLSDALGLTKGPELGKIMKILYDMLVDGELSLGSDFVEEAKKLRNKE